MNFQISSLNFIGARWLEIVSSELIMILSVMWLKIHFVFSKLQQNWNIRIPHAFSESLLLSQNYHPFCKVVSFGSNTFWLIVDTIVGLDQGSRLCPTFRVSEIFKKLLNTDSFLRRIVPTRFYLEMLYPNNRVGQFLLLLNFIKLLLTDTFKSTFLNVSISLVEFQLQKDFSSHS